MQKIQITLPEGVAEGYTEGGVKKFFSLPYAAPITDERRFLAPQPVEHWQGVRDATRPGPSAPQNPPAVIDEIDLDTLVGALPFDGPDCLTLNVFAPDNSDAARPVMVFIHGGSFVIGSKDSAVYDGSAFARDGVILVAINYRMGIEGFLPVEGGATNIGLRDMIAALEWVSRNIAAFGGDPGNVTLFGESGGACCTALLMVSPLTKGLIHRAICQSGHLDVARPREIMQRVTRTLAKRLRIAPTRDGFLSRSLRQLLDAQAKIMMPSLLLEMRGKDRRDPSFGITHFLPIYGDDVLPEPGFEALRKGAGRDVDLLTGANSEEFNIFFVPGGLRDKMNRLIAWFFLSRAIPKAGAALRAYGLNARGAKPGHVLGRAAGDLMFRWLSRRHAEWHQGKSYVYEFDWRSTAFGGELGAAHAAELPFVFDTLACASGERGFLGKDPPQALADSIHALWIRFATDGTAPWPEFDAQTRQVYSLTKGVAAFEPVMPAAAFLP